MNPETQGKLMVAMLISIVAFGTGTGTVLVTGLNHNQNVLNFVNNTPSELPAIPNMNNQNNLNTSFDENTQQDVQITEDNNGQSNGQSNTNNNNNPSNNYNNTTN